MSQRFGKKIVNMFNEDQSMRYIDIISEFHNFSEDLKLSPNCLAWAAHHERAVFNIGDEVHDGKPLLCGFN